MTAVEDGVLHELSPLDGVMVNVGFTGLFIYPPRPDHVPFDPARLRESFLEVINHEYPVFLGSLRVDPASGRVDLWRSIEVQTHQAATIPFLVEKAPESTTTAQVMDELPYGMLPSRDHPRELLTVQCTLLGDGGLVIGINACHGLADGEGFFAFLKRWGMHYRGAVPPGDDGLPNHDRSALAPRGEPIRFPHPEFTIRSASSSQTVSSKPATLPQTLQRAFHLSPEQTAWLKTQANSANDGDTGHGVVVSTIDAVTALLTILITQARGHGSNVTISTAVNGRKRFEPPLPATYSGNVIFNAISDYPASTFHAPSTVESLTIVAQGIRQSIRRRDDAFMRDAVEYIASRDADWTDVRLSANFFLGPDVGFSSWVNMGMYDSDFGVRPSYAGPPRLPLCDGLVIIMEGINATTGLDAMVFLEAKAMANLEKLWNTCALLQGGKRDNCP